MILGTIREGRNSAAANNFGRYSSSESNDYSSEANRVIVCKIILVCSSLYLCLVLAVVATGIISDGPDPLHFLNSRAVQCLLNLLIVYMIPLVVVYFWYARTWLNIACAVIAVIYTYASTAWYTFVHTKEWTSLDADFDAHILLATSWLTFVLDLSIFLIIHNGIRIFSSGENQSLLGKSNGHSPEKNINNLAILVLAIIEAWVNLGLMFTSFAHSFNLIHYSHSILTSTIVVCIFAFIFSIGSVWNILTLAYRGKTALDETSNSELTEPSDPGVKLSFPDDLVSKSNPRRQRSASWSPAPGPLHY